LLGASRRIITRKPVFRYPVRERTVYPSSPSAVAPDGEIKGSCLRAAWYTAMSDRSQPRNRTAAGFWVTYLGDCVEAAVIAHARELGVVVPDSPGFPVYIPELGISGKIDLAFVDNGEVCIGEVKSTSQKNLPFILGYIPRGSYPCPQEKHLMQTMIYLWYFREQGVGRAHIAYVCRDTGADAEFIVRLVKCDDGNHRASVALIGRQSHVVQDITIESIMERYALLRGYIDRNECPPREFDLFYTEEEMDDLINVKKKWRKNSKIAKAWIERRKPALYYKCVWCNNVDECYKNDERFTPDVMREIEATISREDDRK